MSFYTKLFTQLDNLSVVDQAGIETFSTDGITAGVPTMVHMQAGIETEHRGYTKGDVKLAYMLAGSLSAGVESFDDKAIPGANVKGAVIINAQQLGQHPVEAGNEALVTVNPANLKMFTIAQNIAITKSNQGLEEIMPVIMLPCGVKGLAATIELETIHESFVYDKVTNASQLKKINALALLSSGEIFDKFTNKVLPIFNPESDAVLNGVLKYDTSLRGEDIVVAPILVDTQVNLLEITQSVDDIKKGYNSDKTSIHTRMGIKDLYLGDTTDNDPANHWYVKVPLTDTPYSNWTYTAQDETTGFNLSTTIRFKFDTSTVKVGGNGDIIDPLSSAPVGTTVELDMLVTGNGNGEDGVFNLLTSSPAFVSAVDVDGEPITGQLLDDLKAAFAKVTGDSWMPDMALSLEEMRTKGIITSVSTKTAIYMVGQATPIVKYKSAFKGNCDPERLESSLVSEAITYKAIMMHQALTSISQLVASIKGGLTTGVNSDTVVGFGIGRHHIKPCVAEATFNPSVDVRNIESTSAIDDIGGAMATKILTLINQMNAVSGYSLAKSEYERGQKTEVYIWAHTSLVTYLGKLAATLGLGNEYVVKVLAHHGTINGVPDDVVKIMFGTTNSNKTSELNPYQFGNIIVSPSLVYDGIRGDNGSTIGGTYTIPQLLPVINHPVIGLLKIENIKGMPQCC